MSRNDKLVRSDLVCLECGRVFTIQRRINDLKKIGHIKHLYCSKCMMVQPHYEVKEIVSFIWNCFNKGFSNLDENTQIVLNFLVERVDDEVGKEYRIFKKKSIKR